MQFRLIYRGALPSDNSGSRLKDKHRIRRQFHPQLRELWNTVPVLLEWQKYEFVTETLARPNPLQNFADKLADNYALGPFRFLPLMTKKNGLACALDILFLRRTDPGNLITHGGDIDNRIKVLFDALQRPIENDQIRDLSPEPDENPFFCLLEDDRLITDVSVTTDRLLIPLSEGEKKDDVFLVLNVRIKVMDINKARWEFLGE